MKCNICANETSRLFEGLILNKYQVSFYRCDYCDFIQTEHPYWLDDAYDSAISDLDVGIVARNISLSNRIEKIILRNFNCNARFLDYAGGYGLFVRLMRDKGFDFYREDKYCENIFAKYHDRQYLTETSKFELITAFEVLEHLEKPLQDIREMLLHTDSIIVSTELQPNKALKGLDDWWYFTPETGQHISFCSRNTLMYMARQLNVHFYSDGSLHLFTKKKFDVNPLNNKTLYNNIEMESLIQRDFQFAKMVVAKNVELKRDKTSHNIKDDRLITMLSRVSAEVDLVNAELNSIYTSTEWQIVMKLRQALRKILPKGSARRKICLKILRLIQKHFVLSLTLLL
jgi:2-polyprenyl-3-methyl-5-hydroxy-6-metoxy-1,4-benzoquinol methylase